jgi:hypothetical protein
MIGYQNPYQPPETTAHTKSAILYRAREGLAEGAIWGAAIGLGRGVIQALRGTASWYLQIGGSLLVGVLIGTLVCTIGRVVSGRLLGAWIGFGIGLFAGLFVGHALGGYQWTTTSTADGTIMAIGTPIGQIVGSAVGMILGVVVGASADRIVRGEPILDDDGDGSSAGTRP